MDVQYEKRKPKGVAAYFVDFVYHITLLKQKSKKIQKRACH